MDYVINKKGNYGVISPVPSGGLAGTLDKYLQYKRQGAQWMSHPEWAVVHLYRHKTGSFPWGLIKLVEKIMYAWCKKHNESYDNKYKYEVAILKEISSPKLRDYQNEAVHELIKHNGGVLCIPTGGGKTITIIEYLKLMDMVSLVIVPTLDIKKQWEEHNLRGLTVSTYQNPKLKDKAFLEPYQIICFDEAHHVSAKSIYSIAMKTETSTILIGISATLKREDGEDMKIQAALGDIVYEITRKELIAQGWLCNAEVRYLQPLFDMSGATRFMTYQEVYASQIVNNKYRNTQIVQTALKEYRNKSKTLILVTQVEHGEKLFSELEASTFWGGLMGLAPKVVFMNGKSKDRNRDMNQYDIIVATGIYDEGYNLPSLDCLILAAGGKSSIKLTQRIGRVLRIKPEGKGAIIYDFKDTIKYLKTHYIKRRKILENEFNVSDYTDEELTRWVN